MKSDKINLTLDKYESSIVINALLEMRNTELKENRPTDAVDDIILKAVNAPKQRKSRNHEAR